MAFSAFENGNRIEPAYLKHVLTKVGEKLTEEDIELFLMNFDDPHGLGFTMDQVIQKFKPQMGKDLLSKTL